MKRVWAMLFILTCLFVAMSCGCIGSNSNKNSGSTVIKEKNTTLWTESTINETDQGIMISGYNKKIEVSGKEIMISGANHQITVLNADVEEIIISGNNNYVYYPQNAHPYIIDSGYSNVIKTY